MNNKYTNKMEKQIKYLIYCKVTLDDGKTLLYYFRLVFIWLIKNVHFTHSMN